MRPIVLVLVGHYLPGSKAGGPIRSVANLVESLGDEFDFRVVARDRDLGDAVAFAGVPTDRWVAVGKASVRYLPPSDLSARSVLRIVRETAPDLIYAQSYFAPLMSLVPRLARRVGSVRAPILVAPRGEFSPGALTQRAAKKRLLLGAARAVGLDRGTTFHATAPEEAEAIRRVLGFHAEILLAPPIPSPSPFAAPPRRGKERGELRAVFVGRISPKKGLDRAVRLMNRLKEEGVRASLDVWGPEEDAAYADRCRAADGQAVVRWHGPLPREATAAAFASGHVFLFPTLGENYGHAIMESLQAGTPVVASRETPWRGLGKEGAGADVPDEDEAYLGALREVAATDQTGFDALSASAFASARRRSEDATTVESNRILLKLATSRT